MLRDGGVQVPIVHICATPVDELAEAVALGVTVTVQDEPSALALSDAAYAAGVTAGAHVALDTGTGWSGISPDGAGAFAASVRDLKHIDWEGAWTHIAGPNSLPEQLRQFEHATTTLRAAGLAIPSLHVASTGPLMWGLGDNRATAARIGIGLYGSTLGCKGAAPKLKTALEVRAPVMFVKRFERPTSLGYGGKDTVPAGSAVATLRIGYADGLPKGLASRASVRLRGHECRIVGEIGMNFTMVQLPEGAQAAHGDEAIILGDIPGHSLDEVAEKAGMIPHALLTGLGAAMGLRA